MSVSRPVLAWGRLARDVLPTVAPALLSQAAGALAGSPPPRLAYGLGRSYGDVGISAGEGVDMSGLDRLIAGDWERGVVRAEAGLSLDALLKVIVPKGWFVPVTPGTRFVTLGGAAISRSMPAVAITPPAFKATSP